MARPGQWNSELNAALEKNGPTASTPAMLLPAATANPE